MGVQFSTHRDGSKTEHGERNGDGVSEAGNVCTTEVIQVVGDNIEGNVHAYGEEEEVVRPGMPAQRLSADELMREDEELMDMVMLIVTSGILE